MQVLSLLFVVGSFLMVLGVAEITPIFWALYYHESTVVSILTSALIPLASGFLIYLVSLRSKRELTQSEGFVAVGMCWVCASLFGALPYIFTDTLPRFIDAFFESASGFTTTGASVITDVESVAKSILFWRALTHFMGGMGIILLSLAILPLVGLGGMQLYKAEVPGHVAEKLKPRLKETVKILWSVYILFVGVEIILLTIGGMSFFDALCHSFATVATGGFSTKNASIGHYDSPYIEFVISFFMLLAGINFALHYAALKGKMRSYFKNAEARFFFSFVLFAIVVFTLVLWGITGQSIFNAFRHSVFQVLSIVSTTGFSSTDFGLWPPLLVTALFFFMFIGACSGSTGGGMKIFRLQLLMRQAYEEMYVTIHPRAVRTIRLGEQVVEPSIIRSAASLFIIWLAIFTVASVAVAATGLDFVSALSSAIACLSNIGPGFGSVGPTNNYAHLHGLAKLVLTFCMIAGRLELYAVLLLFFPAFWRR